MGALMESFKQTKGERMSHFTGKVYDLTQENFQKVIAELEEARALLRIAVDALEDAKGDCVFIGDFIPHSIGQSVVKETINKISRVLLQVWMYK